MCKKGESGLVSGSIFWVAGCRFSVVLFKEVVVKIWIIRVGCVRMYLPYKRLFGTLKGD